MPSLPPPPVFSSAEALLGSFPPFLWIPPPSPAQPDLTPPTLSPIPQHQAAEAQPAIEPSNYMRDMPPGVAPSVMDQAGGRPRLSPAELQYQLTDSMRK